MQYRILGVVDLAVRTNPEMLDEAALDKYAFVRDAWLQRRRNLVYDGDPPREREEPDDEPTK